MDRFKKLNLFALKSLDFGLLLGVAVLVPTSFNPLFSIEMFAPQQGGEDPVGICQASHSDFELAEMPCDPTAVIIYWNGEGNGSCGDETPCSWNYDIEFWNLQCSGTTVYKFTTPATPFGSGSDDFYFSGQQASVSCSELSGLLTVKYVVRNQGEPFGARLGGVGFNLYCNACPTQP